MSTQFDVRLFDATQSVVREELMEADSRVALEARLAATGAVVLSVRPSMRTTGGASPRRAGAAMDVAWWCRELRTLLAAGMTVVEAIETLNAQSSGHARVQTHAALLMYLQQGLALSAAMQAVGSFPQVLVAGVKASERTSSLIEALDDYLRYHEMLERLRKQVVSAAIYPAVVVSLGGVITLFLLLFVMPRFSRMYSDLRGGLSLTTQAMVGVSRVLNEHGTLVGVSLAVILVATVAAWRGGQLSRAARWMAQRVGPLQRQIDQFRLAKLYHSLALMFRGGYALDDALGQCSAMFQHDGLSERIAHGVRSARDALARGQRVSTAFAEAGLTDTVTQRLLAVGERSGNFDRVLQTIAERHAGNFAVFVERATRIVEPLLLLLVALGVGGIVVMMYMPVFDIASSIR